MNINFLTQGSVQDKRVSQGNLIDSFGGNDRKTAAASKTDTRAVDVSFLAGTDGLRESLLGAGDETNRTQTLTDLQQEATTMDVGVSQDYMTLVANTMSEEDYAEMCEEGFSFETMDPDEAVTIVDKIKAELARGGEVVVGYTDDIDVETLSAAVGSESLARSISESFRRADLPLTEENCSDIAAAWDQASQLTAPTEGSKQYLIENELAPEIWNLYLAQNSGASAAGMTCSGNAAPGDILAQNDGLRQQAERIIEQAGYKVNDQTRQQADWLLQRGLPLTAESLQSLDAIESLTFPVTEEVFAWAVAQAVSEGNTPVHADLSDGSEGKTIYEQAADYLEQFTAEYENTYEQTTDVTARRQLEEVRLRMTAEVNVRLLRSGFAIDTAPMEQLIDALRQAEQDAAQSLFPGDDSAVAKYENWNETNRVTAELPAMPAQLLGTIRLEATTGGNATTLSEFHTEGKTLQATYARAGESYEALMTAPRADLGDSIRKAFANVDDLLTDMNRELTPENQRAVRILGYNQMQITDEAIDRVKAADAQVSEVVGKMTPAATLQMIRDGINPLEKSFAELNEYFANQPESYEQEAESYSKYLYGLERSGEITDEERESFVGVYRLLRQIEKGDGAAIGAVVNTQAQLQFDNLLTAVRSGRFKGIDTRVTNETGVLQELVRAGESLSIDEQIESAYRSQQLDTIREAANVTRDAAAMLERGDIPQTAENLIAAQELADDPGAPFGTLRSTARKLRGETVASGDAVTADSHIIIEDFLSGTDISGTDISDTVLAADDEDSFRAAYTDFLDGLTAETEALTLQAGESIDVRALQAVHRQLSVMGHAAANEEYVIPMEIGGEEATVRLTLDHSGEEHGTVSVSVYTGGRQSAEAHFQVQNGQLEGIFIANTPDEVKNLGQTADIFTSRLEDDEAIDLKVGQLAVVSRDNTGLTWMSGTDSRERDAALDNGTLYRVAKLFLQTLTA